MAKTNKSKKKVSFSKISTVYVLPNYPTPRFGFLRRNYPTSPVTRAMNAYRRSSRPRTPRAIPSHANQAMALARAHRQALNLIRQIRRNNNSNSSSNSSNNNLYK
jgi:hypothetical protein